MDVLCTNTKFSVFVGSRIRLSHRRGSHEEVAIILFIGLAAETTTDTRPRMAAAWPAATPQFSRGRNDGVGADNAGAVSECVP